MLGWIQNLDDVYRRRSLNQATLISGISPKAIEKDWWVTFALNLLFTSKYANYLVFKGGTSLSKGWNIIDRFSEDIDIVLDSEIFGFKYIDKPSKTYVEQLRREGCRFTSNEIASELRSQLAKIEIPKDLYSIEVEAIRENMPDTDPQVIYLNYKSLFDSSKYLADRVKIEFSVRSQNEPRDNRLIQTLLNIHYPNELYMEEPFLVPSIKPNRTLIEKILLLHEEYNRDDENKMRTFRMSRHYYDLFRINLYPEYSMSLSDSLFINEIIENRKAYSRLRHFNYSTLCIGKISIIPPALKLKDLKSDYDDMKLEILYGDVPTFDELIISMYQIQDNFNQIHSI